MDKLVAMVDSVGSGTKKSSKKGNSKTSCQQGVTGSGEGHADNEDDSKGAEATGISNERNEAIAELKTKKKPKKKR